MESAKQAENMQCSSCIKKKETLAKREGLLWQREEMIHIREKELREFELVLEEKNRLLLEKEEQLKKEEQFNFQEEKGENIRKKNISNSDYDFTNQKNENNTLQNEFLLEKERIILEKEKVISEIIKNIEKRDQNILSKEKLLEEEKSVINKERKLFAERIHELDLREQIVKNAEETKLNALFEAKKASDDRIALVRQKEDAVSLASNIIQNKEKALNERENMLIEKEKNLFILINSLNEKSVSKEGSEEESKLYERFDKIFNDRTNILQEREKTIRKKELIIEEKWRNYYKARDLMEIEEGNLKAMIDTFEKEKKMLREWEKLFRRKENKTFEKDAISVEDSVCSSSQVEQVSRSFLDGETNILKQVTEKPYQSTIAGLDRREISGVQLFQLYEKGEETAPSSLLKENVGASGKELKSDSSENVLSKTVQAFFDNVCVNGSTSDVKSESGGSNGNNQLSESMLLNNRNEKNILQETSTQNSDIELDETINSTLKSTDISVPNSNSNEGRKKTCEQEMYMNTNTTPEERKQQIEMNGIVVDKDKQVRRGADYSASQKHVNPCIIPKEENNFQKTNKVSVRDRERITKDDYSSVVNIDLDMGRRASRSSSISSVRSQSSVSGRNSPWHPKAQNKPVKISLVDAIEERNFLEIVKILDSKSVYLEQRDSIGRTALLLAAENGDIDLVERLISMGANVRACDYYGNSAVHLAVSKNKADVVLILLKNGIPLSVTNNDGQTALEIATKKKYSKIIGMLHMHSVKSS